MEVIDLSHMIEPQISVFPGSKAPVLEYLYTVARDGFTEMEITMNSHSATHVDAPCHMIEGGRTLDQYPLSQFVGKALTIDCRALTGNEIPEQLLLNYAQSLATADFVLLYTGWSAKWATPDYLHGYPTLSEKAAEFLAGFSLKGIGVDTISVDPVESTNYPVHHIILGKQMIIIENLANLELLTGKTCTLSCLPLKFKQADASPVRCMGML